MSHVHVNDPSRTGNFTASLPFAVINVAAGKAPMQSSTHQDGIPQKAVDGSTSGLFSPQTCTLTQPEVTPLWYVNLLEPFMIQLVRIDFGRACCGEWDVQRVSTRLSDKIAWDGSSSLAGYGI